MVIYQLLEVVSRNGCLLLNVPLTPEGSLDPGGEVLLAELADWMAVCGEGIYDSTPWIKCLEGENRMPRGNLKDPSRIHFDSSDFRFTRKGDTVYTFCITVPKPGETVTIRSFKDFTKDTDWGKKPVNVEILGSDQSPEYWQDGQGLHIRFSGDFPTRFAVCVMVRFLI